MMLTQKRAHLNREEAMTVAIIEAAVPVLTAARHLLERFQAMIRQRDASGLEAWLEDASSGPFASFARGLQDDQRAVGAALSLPWSNGQTEGLTIPGIGPLIATAIATLAPPPEAFRKGRDFAAWLGLTPRQHSTGGKQRLGATTKMGERSLRRLLIIGANSVIIKRHCHASARAGTWLARMLESKSPMLVRVALANKMARIVWALMKSGEVYRAPAMAA